MNALLPLLSAFLALAAFAYLNGQAFDVQQVSPIQKILARSRRSDRNPDATVKKIKLEEVASNSIVRLLDSRGVTKRIDIAECLLKQPKPRPPKCDDLLIPDKFHPFDLEKYLRRKRDLPMKLPFPFTWLLNLDFLEHSASKNSIFCRFCTRFTAEDKVGPLITEPIAGFNKRTLSYVKEHGLTKYHLNAKAAALKHYEELNSLPSSEDAEPLPRLSREDLSPALVESMESIVRTLIFLVRQDLALRKEKTVLTDDFSYRTNSLFESIPWHYSNFEAAILFRIDAGDAALLHHMQNFRPRLMSWDSQNKILKVAFDVLQKQILEEAKASPYFAIILDETMDASGKQQLTFFLRYLYENGIKEQFLEFADTSESGAAAHLLEVVENTISNHGLDLHKLRGQGYDGASPMAGSRSGLQTLIRQKYPKAVFVHCFAHVVNLALLDALEGDFVKQWKNDLTQTGKFFSSARRRSVLSKIINIKTGPQRPKVPVLTRWTSLEGVNDDFLRLFPDIVDALGAMSQLNSGVDSRTATAASKLRSDLLSYPMVLLSVISENVLGKLKRLSETVQHETKEYSEAMQDFAETIESLKLLRIDVAAGTKFDEWWRRTESLLEPYQIQPKLLTALPDSNSKATYLDVIALKFLNGLIKALENRLSTRSPILERLGDLLPQAIAAKPELRASDFNDVIKFYSSEFQTVRDFEAQFMAWKLLWGQHPGILPSGLSDTLAQITEEREKAYSMILTLLRIHATVPVTTASGERSSSLLKIIKNRLRSRMDQERLNSLTLISSTADRAIDTELIARTFLLQSRRKVRMNDKHATTFVEQKSEQTSDETYEPLPSDESGFFDDEIFDDVEF